MSDTARRALVAVVLAAGVVVSGCGLDDGARVRNQDNVRNCEPEASETGLADDTGPAG